VPLRTGVQDPEHRVEYLPRWNWSTTRTRVRNALLRKIIPDSLPISVAYALHALIVGNQNQNSMILR
jgi:hypothetical protein